MFEMAFLTLIYSCVPLTEGKGFDLTRVENAAKMYLFRGSISVSAECRGGEYAEIENGTFG